MYILSIRTETNSSEVETRLESLEDFLLVTEKILV